MNRCKRLEHYDPNAAHAELATWNGPVAVVMPEPGKHNDLKKVWTTSIKVALKFMAMPTRYVHIQSIRVDGMPIHRFYTHDAAEEVATIVENVQSESIPLIPIHREALRTGPAPAVA